jgi:hypothetical protein
VSISISKKIVHLTRLATGVAAGFKTGGVLIYRSPSSVVIFLFDQLVGGGSKVRGMWELLQKEAQVFVCGEASRMAPDVKQAFISLFCKRF